MKELFDLKGRRALVTGSSRGIGKGIAMALADAGADVIIHASSEGSRMSETVAEIEAAGGKAVGIAADLSDDVQIDELIKKVEHVDILILNASIQSYQNVENFSSEEFQREYKVNLESTFKLIQGFVPSMKDRGRGRIITIGSVNQYKPAYRLSIYSTTKAAQVNLMMNCAKEYASFGITVNNIAPGVILTDRNSGILADEGFRQKILEMVPAGRFGDLTDCAGLALLLSSDAGSYITGTDIPVAGGMQL
ncbi:MAG: SDR family oxidoreductase [Kiritimatiellae bacterium]|jgi:glucose 1-dehydrogenase|nr:SDR family oxidoreductase [Kiritimatiellia bacterium]